MRNLIAQQTIKLIYLKLLFWGQ